MGIELEDGVEYVTRAPTAMVLRAYGRGKRPFVVCSDGACFEYVSAEWVEREPVPGTARAISIEGERCGVIREGSEPPQSCMLDADHEPPHIDATGFRWA